MADGFAVAAHHRDSPLDETGFSFVNCTVRGTGTVFLGRAWGPFSRIIYSYTELDIDVRPQGWQDWGIPSRRKYEPSSSSSSSSSSYDTNLFKRKFTYAVRRLSGCTSAEDEEQRETAAKTGLKHSTLHKQCLSYILHSFKESNG